MIRSWVTLIKIVAVSSAVISAVGAFWYITGLRADLETARQNVATLESSVVEQQGVIDQIREDQRQIQQFRNELDIITSEQQNEIDDLRDRFNESASGSDRDLGQLALQKPGLIENIINSSSEEAARCIEIASGAELTEGERNATTRSQINSECPSLANPSYSDNN